MVWQNAIWHDIIFLGVWLGHVALDVKMICSTKTNYQAVKISKSRSGEDVSIFPENHLIYVNAFKFEISQIAHTTWIMFGNTHILRFQKSFRTESGQRLLNFCAIGQVTVVVLFYETRFDTISLGYGSATLVLTQKWFTRLKLTTKSWPARKIARGMMLPFSEKTVWSTWALVAFQKKKNYWSVDHSSEIHI